MQRKEHINFSCQKGTLRVGQSVIGRGLVPNPIGRGRGELRVSHGEQISGKYVDHPMVRCVWGAMEGDAYVSYVLDINKENAGVQRMVVE